MFTKHEQIRAAVRLQKRTKVHQIKDPFGWLRAAPAPAPKSLFIYTYFTVHRSPFSLSSPPLTDAVAAAGSRNSSSAGSGSLLQCRSRSQKF